MFNKRDEEVERLKKDVRDLKTVVKYLASALDKVSENQGVLSDTMSEFAETQRESLDIQGKLISTSRSQSEKLENIERGVNTLLKRLSAPSDEEEE